MAAGKLPGPARSTGVSLVTSGTTTAICFVYPQTAHAVPAPYAPAAQLDEPGTAASHTTLATAASPPWVTMLAVLTQVAEPQPPAEALSPPEAAALAPLNSAAPVTHLLLPPCGWGGRTTCAKYDHCTPITRRRYHTPREITTPVVNVAEFELNRSRGTSDTTQSGESPRVITIRDDIKLTDPAGWFHN